MANPEDSPVSGSFALRAAMTGFVGALMFVGGIPTLVVGIVTGERSTVDIAVLLLVGGFLFALVGVPAAVYLRSHSGPARRDSDDSAPREDGGGWV